MGNIRIKGKLSCNALGQGCCLAFEISGEVLSQPDLYKTPLALAVVGLTASNYMKI